MNEAEIIKKTIPHLGEKMCALLNIEPGRAHELLDNFVVESKLSGHNNEISFLNFYNTEKVLLGRACFKGTAERKKESKLQIESVVLNILKSEDIACPMMIDIGLNA